MRHTVVRRDNAVHAATRAPIAAWGLEHDGADPVLAQEREVFPSVERARAGLLKPPYAEGQRLARLRISRRETRPSQVERERGARVATAVRLLLVHEDRVGRADLHADARGEGQVSRVEIVGGTSREGRCRA